MKAILCLFMLLPVMAYGQNYFRGDTAKVIRVIHANSGIVKESRYTYSIAGDVSVELSGNDTIKCDRALFDRQKGILYFYGNVKQLSKPPVNIGGICDPKMFVIKTGDLLFDGIGR